MTTPTPTTQAEAPIGRRGAYLPVEILDRSPKGFQPGWVHVKDLTGESGHTTLAVRAERLRERP